MEETTKHEVNVRADELFEGEFAFNGRSWFRVGRIKFTVMGEVRVFDWTARDGKGSWYQYAADAPVRVLRSL